MSDVAYRRLGIGLCLLSAAVVVAGLYAIVRFAW